MRPNAAGIVVVGALPLLLYCSSTDRTFGDAEGGGAGMLAGDAGEPATGGSGEGGSTDGIGGGGPGDGGSDQGDGGTTDGGSGASDGGSGEPGGAGAGGSTDPGIVEPPSCQTLPADECNSESCCTAIELAAGSFMMGRSTNGTDQGAGSTNEQPEHSVSVTGFQLDKYEVTVGRFRRFADAFDDWRAAGHPQAGEGAHPAIDGTGWKAAWDSRLTRLPVSREDLIEEANCSEYSTWTDAPGDNEQKAINCVSWFTAFAFCAWDGGRLPTEAEWEYAAAGGVQNRKYPWGDAEPAQDAVRAVYGCLGECRTEPVGSAPSGKGRWGHLDLSGNLSEWVFDWYDSAWYGKAGATGANVVNLTEPASGVKRIRRGGDHYGSVGNLRAAYRGGNLEDPSEFGGLRCARDAAPEL